jgi:hypothetical protein
MDYLSLDDNFSLLSLADLLVARDQFHLHLIHKPNVVGTAVGRYRIRKSDPWPDKDHPEQGPRRKGKTPPRTLENSEVRPYSWPAILVFVDRWIEPGDFAHPQDAVPPAVFQPNGHRVPICVVQAERDERRPEGEGNYNFPANLIGGGYPVLCEVQEQQHIASLGCLVTDGHRTYALTNRHVAGEPGSPIYSIIGGNTHEIGKSAGLQLTRELFTTLYPEWPGKNVYVDLDVGLIDIYDLNRWTTQVYGIGEIGELADLDDSNLSLRVIGAPVRAFGAASRLMLGEICALFYRFKSVGGFEYVADLLIGARRSGGSLGTHPGDSGTLWLIEAQDSKSKPTPVALQWGGQVFTDQAGLGSSYALATLLSTVCNKLDVTLLRNWQVGLPEYWGAVGHYSIATKAISKIRNAKLKQLMSANLERISFATPDINKKNMAGLSKKDFVPLADVPDMVWKVGPFKRGGMTAPEHANHFADMDRKLAHPLPAGATLLQICNGKPQNVAVAVWQQYYDAVQQEFPQKESRGLLPFRVWQIFDAMVGFLKAGQVAEFVCAAGIISHYVGDSCQPLHISYLFNGDPDQLVPGMVKDAAGNKVPGQVPRGNGVHASYEDDMIDDNVLAMSNGVDARLQAAAAWPLLSAGGHSAAVSVVNLMQKTFAAIAPAEIIDTFVPLMDEKPAARATAMWAKLGERTMDVMSDGCLCLAQLWDSAWDQGDGDQNVSQLGAIDPATLENIYRPVSFLPSHTLDTIGPVLGAAPTSATPASRVKTAAKKKAAARKSPARKKKTPRR